MSKKLSLLGLSIALLVVALPAHAVIEPIGNELLQKVHWHPDMQIQDRVQRASDLTGSNAGLAGSLSAVGAAPQAAKFDERAGRWTTLVMTTPLVPGPGFGNRLSWDQFGASAPGDEDALGRATADAFRGFLAAHASTFGVELDQMDEPNVGVHDGGRLVQMHVARRIEGIPVRDSYITAVVNSGNLVLYGLRNWGPADVNTSPSLEHGAAADAVRRHLGEIDFREYRAKPRLEIVPLAPKAVAEPGRLGKGAELAAKGGTTPAAYDYRLVWVISPKIDKDFGGWEALVDAHSGDLLAFYDANHYQSTRTVTGGVLPITNDGLDDSGTEQPNWPMPFADVTEVGSGREFVTDSAGNLPACVTGDIVTHLDSRYVKMVDGCNPVDGTITVSSADPVFPDIDLGFAAPAASGTDCAAVIAPPHSNAPGNSRASRSGFYEVNRIHEQARGYLPNNPWVREQLTANMNIQDVCNAFWNGSSINFYKFSGACSNTGEIAAVFDHEWGHGMDDNDVTSGVSAPGEGIADIYMFLRLGTSCVGRNFSAALGCNSPARGYGDPCNNDCSGVRDVNYHNRTSGVPHTVAFGLSNCSPAGNPRTPCGGSTHCEGAIYAEAIFDLATRDLRCQGAGGWVDDGPPFDGDVEGGACAGGPGTATMDANTAYELAARLTYRGAGLVSRWYDCVTDGTGGCRADGGYLSYLAADDDNGNLFDGTPHMSAIFDAFDRHLIACPDIPVMNSGCAGGPTTAPTVTTAPLDRAARLTWGLVPGADAYDVFRAEGLFGCDAGKTPLGRVPAADCTGPAGAECEFVALGLQNGFEYYFNVLPVGSSTGLANACVGVMSSCATEIPSTGPNLAIDANATLALVGLGADPLGTADDDEFLDNCENGEFTFDVFNVGDTPLTGVEVVSVSSPSHPSFTFGATPITVGTGSVGLCASGSATIPFTAFGVAYQDTVEFEVEVTANELPAGGNQTAVIRFLQVGQSDYQHFTTSGPDFEAVPSDFFPFEVLGVFNRTDVAPPGGAAATTGYARSSRLVDGACDELRTPLIRLGATSTLSLSNQYDVEPFTPTPYDRANVGFINFDSKLRDDVIPSSGRAYDIADGSPNGACDMEGQPGWAGTSANFGTAAGWSAVGFDSASLHAVAPPGETVQLSILYGTDGGLALEGFFVDQITLTDFELQVPESEFCGVNVPPTAVDDSAVTLVDTAVSIDVLANDFDPEGSAPEIVTLNPPVTPGSSVVVNDNGTPGDGVDDFVDYTPAPGFSGIDTFTYNVWDAGGALSNFATVSVDVQSNGLPVATPDLAFTTQDVPIQIDVLDNDFDLNGDPIAITAIDPPVHGGTATVNNAGTPGDPSDDFIDFTPAPGFTSPPPEAFVYTISDGIDSDTAVVSITVAPFCPAAPTGTFSDDAESAIAGYLTETTRDVGGWSRLSDATATSPSNAWVALDDQPGSPTLTAIDHRLTLPALHVSSTSTLTFWHNYDFARFPASAEATSYQSGGVLEMWNGAAWVDLEPYFVSGGYTGTVDADASASANPIRTRNAWVGTSSEIGDPRTGPNGRTQPMELTEVDLGAAILGVLGQTDAFNVKVRFRLGGTFQALGGGIQGTGWGIDDITVTNTLEQGACPPVAIDDFASTDVDTVVYIDALANDGDPNAGDTISFFGTPTAPNGTVVVHDNTDKGFPGSDFLLEYTPDPGFSGTDVFSYTIEDTASLQASANITVEVGDGPAGCVVGTPLFTDAFESGDPSAWTLVRNPSGDLSVVGTAPLEGSFHMKVDVDRTGGASQLDHYVAASHADTGTYCWSFLFDPATLDIPVGRFARIWGARGSDNRRLMIMALRNIGGTLHVALQVYKDGFAAESVPFAPLPGGPVLLGGEWSNTANGGVLKMFIDGVEQPGSLAGVSPVSRDLRTPGMGNLGQLAPGSVGSMFFDAFVGGSVAP